MRRLVSFVIAFAACLQGHAELPPSAYEKMQRESPEVLRVNVLRVDSSPETPETSQITILAEVVKIGRSAANLSRGDLITIKYRVTERPPGWVGPGEIPIPEIDKETMAFLAPIEGENEFTPSAGAMSFKTF